MKIVVVILVLRLLIIIFYVYDGDVGCSGGDGGNNDLYGDSNVFFVW